MTIATVILIAYFKIGYSGNTMAQEFSTEASCRSAIEQLEKQRGFYWAICVPK